MNWARMRFKFLVAGLFAAFAVIGIGKTVVRMVRVAFLCALVVLVPVVSRANIYSGVSSLTAGSWDAAGVRSMTAGVKAGNLTKYFRVGLSPASLALIAATMLGGALIDTYKEDALTATKAYLASAGLGIVGGATVKYTSSWVPVPGTPFANNLVPLQAVYPAYAMVPTSTSTTAAAVRADMVNHCVSHGTYLIGGASAAYPSGGATCYYDTFRCNGAGHETITVWPYPVTPNPAVISQVNTPVPATPTEFKTKIQTDLTASQAGAQNMWKELEGVIGSTYNGAAVWQIPSVGGAIALPGILEKPAAGLGTPQAAIDTAVKAQVPAQAITDLETAANPASGTEVVAPPAPGVKDPAYTGTSVTPTWPAIGDFGAQWKTFTDNLKTKGLFALPGQFFASMPSGGSSVFSFSTPHWGTHSYDFASWGSVTTTLRAVFLIIFGWVAIRIVTKGGGG
jgi:hypothetical protein